ncbi:MAG: hypothetical protein GX989_05185 [Firmicutes bacterium]|nr:hypothetical protein [Bacillota bacterium]
MELLNRKVNRQKKGGGILTGPGGKGYTFFMVTGRSVNWLVPVDTGGNVNTEKSLYS